MSQTSVGLNKKRTSQELRAEKKRGKKGFVGKEQMGKSQGTLNLAHGVKFLEKGSPGFCAARWMTCVLALTAMSQK